VRAEWKYGLLGDTLGALGDLDMAVSQQKNFVEARIARAILLLEVPMGKDAEKELRALSRALPEPSKKAAVEALAKTKAKDYAGAKDLMVQAMRAMPDDLAFLNAKTERPARPAWKGEVSAPSENYMVRVELLADDRDKDAWTAKAKGWAGELEAAREHIATLIPGASKKPGITEVLIFADEEAYHDYADSDPLGSLIESAGMYMSDRRQIVVQGRKDPKEVRRILFHEACHEYARAAGLDVPTWLDEGLADYASGVAMEDGKITARGQVLGVRLEDLQAAMREGWGGVPFEQLLRSNQKEFYGALRSLQYAQAWSLVHFFRHAKGGEYLSPFTAYLRELSKGSSPSDAGRAALGKLDLEALQAEWLEYVKTLK
jgi:hypothetical protein